MSDISEDLRRLREKIVEVLGESSESMTAEQVCEALVAKGHDEYSASEVGFALAALDARGEVKAEVTTISS